MRSFKIKASDGYKLRVTPYVINKGQTGEYYGLKNVDENQVLPYTPTWKTKKGAIAWAKKRGYEVVESSTKRQFSVKAAWRPVKEEYITDEFLEIVDDPWLNRRKDDFSVVLMDGNTFRFICHGLTPDLIEKRLIEVAKRDFPKYDIFDLEAYHSGNYKYKDAPIGSIKESVRKKRQHKAVKAETNPEYWNRFEKSGKNPYWDAIDEPIVQFNKDLLRKARNMYYKVYVDNISEDGTKYEGSETATKGVRIRLIPTDWDYSEEEVFRSDKELKDYLEANESEYEVDASTKTVKASSSAKKRKAIKASANYNNWQQSDMSVYIDGRKQMMSKYTREINGFKMLVMPLYNSATDTLTYVLYAGPEDDFIKIEDQFTSSGEAIEYAETYYEDALADSAWEAQHGVTSATSNKRRSVKASDYRDDDIVMYFNGENVFTGSIYDLADAVENLCYDEEVNAKFMEWCNQFGDPFDFDGSPIDTARTFADIVIHEADEGPVTDDGTTQFYVDGDGILNFEIFYANDGIYSATNIKCNDGVAPDDYDSVEDMISDGGYDYNGYDDGDFLEDVDQYFRRFDDIWLNADFVSYNGPDDWSVDASLSSDGVGSDFNYFLEDNFPDLYETLNTSHTTEPDDYHDSYSYDLLDVLVPNDFSIQFYPGNNQFSAPQIDFDTEDRQLKAKLEEARSAYESSRIAAYKNLQNGLGEYLASGITASTNIECAKSLNLNARNNWDEWVLYGYDINGADVDTRVIDFQDNVRDAVGELFAWPEVDTVDLYKRDSKGDADGFYKEDEYFNTITRTDYEADDIEASTDIFSKIDIGNKVNYSDNPIYELSGYVRMLSDEVQKLIDDDIAVTVSDEAITFTKGGEVIYIQPTAEIIPEPDDLEADAEELATAVGSVLYDKAMREDFDSAWGDTYDEDYATRAVEFSTDTDDDLEPITGTASAEDRIFDIITDKLRSSELAEFGDVDLLNGDADIKIHSNGADLDYIIAFVGDPATVGFEDRFMKYTKNPNYNDLNADSITNLATEIVVEDGMIKSVNFVNLDDNDLTNYDIAAYEDFIRKMAEPTVSEIYTFIDEAVNDGSIQASVDPNLEPITGEDDFGFGFDSNGEAVSESMVDELERIAQEILNKSLLCKEIDQYASIKQFNYYASVPYVQESFFITFTYTADYYELSERDILHEDGWYSTNGDYEFNFNVYCKNGEVEYAECLGLSPKDVKMFSVDRLELFAERLVAPVASEIYNVTTNI